MIDRDDVNNAIVQEPAHPFSMDMAQGYKRAS
jgi:hypothetical protein